jgi:aspartate/methionine/tyrosine aminotransferase
MKKTTKTLLEKYGVTIFTEVNRLAAKYDALNLSQGYPDFDGPDFIKEAAARAMKEGKNQYAPSHGVPELRKAIAWKYKEAYGIECDPDAEVTVFSGATEGIFSSIMGLTEPGDEVVLIEPYYDTYPPCTEMAGGIPKYVPLRFPDFALESDALRAAMSPRTKLIVLNTPMNPTGKVYTLEELMIIASAAHEFDAYVVSDEVYEHLTFDGRRHIPIASLPGMWERTVTISSTAKTFSMTGWKIGWAVAPGPLSTAVRMAHQFVTFCTATPLQYAMAEALRAGEDYFEAFRREYEKRRSVLVGHLEKAGFLVKRPAGTYFVLADFSPFPGGEDDFEFCRFLMKEVKVASIPVSAFYHDRTGGRTQLRFAFCKGVDSLEEAGARLLKLREVRS